MPFVILCEKTVIEWSENLDYNILTTPASRIFEVIPNADACVVNMYAMDHGQPDKPPDARYYDVIRPDRGGGFSLGGTGEDGNGGSSTPGAGNASGSTTFSFRFAAAMAFAALLAVAI